MVLLFVRLVLLISVRGVVVAIVALLLSECCCYCCCYCSSCAAVVADTAVATVAVAATDVAVAAVPDEATAPAATTTPRTLPSNENKRAKVNKSRMHLFARAGLSIPSRKTPSICLLHFSITCT